MALGTEPAKRWFIRGWSYLSSRPIKIAAYIYSNPSIVVLLASMFSGIFLSTGMSLILIIISADKVRRFGAIQYLGLTMVIWAVLYAWVAWSAQQFLDYLRSSLDENEKPKDWFPTEQKRGEFEGWIGRRGANRALFLLIVFIATFIIVMMILVLSVPNGHRATVYLHQEAADRLM